MQTTNYKINITKYSSPRLGFRSAAAELFTSLESIKANTIEIDFKNTKFISRSFAHEYLILKKNQKKE
jgi:hypothetical protein